MSITDDEADACSDAESKLSWNVKSGKEAKKDADLLPETNVQTFGDSKSAQSQQQTGSKPI